MKQNEFKPIKYKELKEDSIQHWAEELEKCKLVELTHEQTDLFITTTVMEMREKEADVNSSETDKRFEKAFLGSFNGVAILWNRVKKCHTYKISHGVTIFLGSIIENPGTAVILANFLQYKAWKHHIHFIDMEMLGAYIFPNGIFSAEDLEKAWDAQKVEFDGLKNMLDMTFPMKSIREIPERTNEDEDELRKIKIKATAEILAHQANGPFGV